MSGEVSSLSLPSVFTSHAVLQRGVPLPVWGRAEPARTVTVQLAGQTETAVADPDGRWLLELDPLEAGGPHQMVVASGEHRIVLEDVLIGDVWVCSGQSNMQWPVCETDNAAAEIREADHPTLRLLTVPNVTADEPQEDFDGAWVRCTPETAPLFSAVAYFFGRELNRGLRVPVGLINTSWGGTPAQAWTRRPKLESDPMLRGYLERWAEHIRTLPEQVRTFEEEVMPAHRAAVETALAAGEDPPMEPWPPQGEDSPHKPCCLYNAMIAPLVPFGIRGAIWYQGESNVDRAHEYEHLFSAMIEDWREAWGQGDFPFYYVQLANWTPVLDEPADSDWAELREAQLQTLGLPGTGMAVTIDIGDADDIHPRNKQDVGRRLALWALAKTHGRDIAYSGPLYAGMTVADGCARIAFTHTDGGLQARGDTLLGFAIAGEDRVFHWAEAQIDGDKVVVSAPKVAEPVAVRYAWANNPVCNLYNGAGLPASPFRTDTWPGITTGR